jgi:hypothetical protein
MGLQPCTDLVTGLLSCGFFFTNCLHFWPVLQGISDLFLISQNGARFNLAKNQSFLSYVFVRNSTSHEIREPEDQQF